MFGAPHPCWEIYETDRTRVREITVEDVPALFRLYEKPGAADYMEPLDSFEEEVEYTKAYIEKIYGFYGYGMWVVISKSTGDLIGRVGFDDRTDSTTGRILELGYMIDRDLWRQGYGTEVVTAAIDYAFTALDEECVTCLIRPENTVSIAFVKKLGFTETGPVRTRDRDFIRFDKTRQK